MSVKLPTIPMPDTDVIDDGSVLRVGDLAQRTQKTVRALHLYEELGLLRPSERSKGGFRLYGSEAVLRVQWIAKLQDMGFSLPDIKEIVVGWEASQSAPGAMHRIRDLYVQKLEDARAQIARLRTLERELEHSVRYLDTCESCDPERLISSCTRCDLTHSCEQPGLVSGLHSQRH